VIGSLWTGRKRVAHVLHATYTSVVQDRKPLTDEELAGRMFAGDEEAARELLERYRRPLYSLLFSLTRDYHDAEDAFQETFLRAVRAGSTYDSSRKFRPWLYAIGLNIVRDTARRRQKNQDPKPASADELERIAQPSGPESAAGNIEAAQLVNRALDRLSEEHRIVIVLRFFHSLSESEIAEAAGIPRGTVKSRLHNAINRMRKMTVMEEE